MKITIIQEYEVEIPKEYESKTKEDLVNDLNSMYDIHGKDIIKSLNAEDEYLSTTLITINDENVYRDSDGEKDFISANSGRDIILDGQPLRKEI